MQNEADLHDPLNRCNVPLSSSGFQKGASVPNDHIRSLGSEVESR